MEPTVNANDHASQTLTARVVPTFTADRPRLSTFWGTLTRYLSLPVLFLAGVATLNLWSLMHTPAPFVDEAWFADRALAQIQTGYGFGQLDAGLPNRLDGYEHVLMWFQPLIESIPIRLFGLSLFAVRSESLVFGIALLIVIYAIVRKLYDSRMAFITMAVAAFSSPFIFSSHMARPDILIALCGFGALALYLYDRSSGFTPKSVLSGLLIGLAIDIHPNIILFGPVMLGLFLLDFRLGMFRKGRFWGFAIGAAMGLAFYAAVHILPNPQTYAEINRLESSLAHTPTILIPDPEKWLWTIKGTFLLIDVLHWPLILGAIVLLWKRRSPSDKRLLVIFATLVGAFTVIVASRPAHYMILLAPPAWLLVGALINYLIKQPWKGTGWLYARTVLVVSLMLTSAIYAVAPMFKDPTNDWEATLEHVRQTVPAESMIIGQQNWWFARPEFPYMSWEQIVYYRRYAPGSTIEDAFRNLNPDYLIMDQITDGYLLKTMDVYDTEYFSSFVLKSEMEAFMQKHCRIVSSITTANFGNVRIYKIVW